MFGDTIEWAFTLVAVLFATGALIVGWRKHRSMAVAALLTLGIIGLLTARGVEASSGHHEAHGTARHGALPTTATGHALAEEGGLKIGPVIGILAGLFLVSGHVLNIRATRRCSCGRCVKNTTAA